MKRKIPNINARDFGTILNLNPYQTPFNLLEEKIEKKFPFFGNKFTEHGNKYEQVAIDNYSSVMGIKVNSIQKNIKHPEYEWITGRCDGIIIHDDDDNSSNKKKRKITEMYEECNDEDRNNKNKKILEIKCPLKKNRSEPLTLENIPKYYWSQCQVYMNMINCEKTHYVEFYIEPNACEKSGVLHYIEIQRDYEWWEKSLPKIKSFYEEIKKYHELGSLDTHPVRISEKKWMNKF